MGNVLIIINSSSNKLILNSGISNHIVVSKDYFSSLIPYTRPSMLMGDNTPMRLCREGRMHLDYRIFLNLLHVPNVSMNLLYIFDYILKYMQVS